MTTCEEEVQHIGRKLEKIIAGKKEMDSAPEMIEALANLPITLEVLTKTRIGMVINALRKKTNDEQLSKRAKALIRDWKNLFDGKTKKSGSSKKTIEKAESKSASVEPTESESTEVSSNRSSIQLTNPNVSSSKNKSNELVGSGDEVRDKSVEMINNALRWSELPDGTLNPNDLAIRIENKLFEVHRGTGEKYRSALRSRVFNLRDKKNLALRENVLTGTISSEKFAVMTAEEMASDEIKKKREEFTKAAILEHQMSVTEGTPSDMFRCGKCGKNNCTYNQMQTRSADEPMTTFVYCRVCGNRWKFC